MAFVKTTKDLEPSQVDWLIKHFQHTKNKDIRERFGISQYQLNLYTKRLGLKKTSRFLKSQCREHIAMAHKSLNRIREENPNRWEEIQETRKRNFENGVKFKPGESNADRYSKKKDAAIRQKAQDSIKKKRDRDRARVNLGLKPLSRLYLGIPTVERTKRNKAKNHLKNAYGYRFDGLTAYYTADMKRSPRENRYSEKYKFKFVEEKANKEIKKVIVVPDWSAKQGGFTTE